MWRDDATGLLYARARHYSPALGRFTSADPVGRWYDRQNVGSAYAFVGNRYRNGYDPYGLADEVCCGTGYSLIVVQTDAFSRWYKGFKDASDERIEELKKSQASEVKAIKQAFANAGLGTTDGRGESTVVETDRSNMDDARGWLDWCAKDPCCRGLGYTGHSLGGGRLALGDHQKWYFLHTSAWRGKVKAGMSGCYIGACSWDSPTGPNSGSETWGDVTGTSKDDGSFHGPPLDEKGNSTQPGGEAAAKTFSPRKVGGSR